MSTSTTDPPQDLPTRHIPPFATFRAVAALALREMATTYGRSPGGYIWAILQPVGTIAIMTVVFGLIQRSPGLGTNFPIFYATGIISFGMYNNLASSVGGALSFSKALMRYPRVTFVDAMVARLLVNGTTHLLVGYVVVTGIRMIWETRTAVDLPAVALSLAMATVIGTGVGAMNCFLMGMFPVWRHFWQVLTRPLFIASGIIFLFDNVPQPYRDWLWYNPLIHVVGQMRSGFYPYYDALYVTPEYVFGIGLTLLVTGLVLLRRFKLEILNR